MVPSWTLSPLRINLTHLLIPHLRFVRAHGKKGLATWLEWTFLTAIKAKL